MQFVKTVRRQSYEGQLNAKNDSLSSKSNV